MIKACVDHAPAGVNPHLPVALLPLDLAQAAIVDSRRWKVGQTIRLLFLGGRPDQQTAFRKAAKEWMRHCNLRFVEVLREPAECRVSFAPGSSWSVIGTDALTVPAGRPTTNIGWDGDDGTELHELGHFLGLVHEHQQPAAGIPWDEPAVLAYYSGPPNHWDPATIRSNVLARYGQAGITNSEYDGRSIMQYPIDPGLTGGRLAVAWNRELSDQDRHFIGTCYPFATASPPTLPALTIGSPKVRGALVRPGESIRYGLAVAEPGWYRIETTGTTDVAVDLANVVGRLLSDDDNGIGRNARIDAPLAPGDYTVEVRAARRGGTGAYHVGVRPIKAPRAAS